MKNTGVATLGEISDFSQVAAIQEMDEVVLNQEFSQVIISKALFLLYFVFFTGV